MKSTRLERGLGLALLGFVVVLGLAMSFLQEGTPPKAGSVGSTEEDGRAAVFALLRELGVPAREWRDAPNRLPRKPALLWLPRVPTAEMPQSTTRRSKTSNAPPRTGLHSLGHYFEFVEAGGTILMPAGPEAERFLLDELELDEAPASKDAESGAKASRLVTSSSGESFRIDGRDVRTFEPLDPNGTARALWTIELDGRSEPFVVGMPVGAGTIALIAGQRFVDNDVIGSLDNALAAERLVEDLDHGGPVLFGEYELGRWDSPSTVGLAFTPTLLLVTLHALALLALLTWNHAYARAFPRDPEPHELFSALQRARSLAGVFERAGRYSGLASMLRRSTFHRLEDIARARVRGAAAPTAPKSAAALAPVSAEDARALALRAGMSDLAPRLEELLVARRVERRADLDRLDAQLRLLEADVSRRMHSRSYTRGVEPVEASEPVEPLAAPTSPALDHAGLPTHTPGHSRPTETP